MMDKVALLQDKASEFQALLEAHQVRDTDAMLMLRWLTPLFNEIALGEVVPPRHYEFRLALGNESAFDEVGSPLAHAHSEFMAALEDWPSQPWYYEALKRSGKH